MSAVFNTFTYFFYFSTYICKFQTDFYCNLQRRVNFVILFTKGVKKMKIRSGFAIRQIAGSNIVVPVGQNSLDFNGMITLNDTGAFLWNTFQQDTTVEAAAKALTEAYEVDLARAQEDVKKFTDLLRENALLEN